MFFFPGLIPTIVGYSQIVGEIQSFWIWLDVSRRYFVWLNCSMLEYHVHLPLSKPLQRLLKLSVIPSFYNIKRLTDGPKEV